LLLLIAHGGTGAIWVFSTVLLQQESDEAFLGRVFAAEMGLFTLSYSVFVVATGFLIEDFAVSPPSVARGIGLLLMGVAGTWFLASRQIWRRRL
jgi:hypothetical protein